MLETHHEITEFVLLFHIAGLNVKYVRCLVKNILYVLSETLLPKLKWAICWSRGGGRYPRMQKVVWLNPRCNDPKSLKEIGRAFLLNALLQAHLSRILGDDRYDVPCSNKPSVFNAYDPNN